MSTPTLLALFVSLSIFTATTNAVPAKTIAQICSKSINQGFCLGLLKSNPAVAKAANLKGVGGIVFNIAASKASQTKSIVASLAAKTGNPALKKRSRACLEYYGNAVSDIGDAQKALAENDGGSMNQYLSSAQTYVMDCQDEFSRPPSDRSDLPKRNSDLFNTLSIGLVISNNIKKLVLASAIAVNL